MDLLTYYPALLDYYPALKGSHGQIHVRVRQAVLDQVCALIETQAPHQVHRIRITPSGQNRFRIFAELSNPVFNWLGHIFLHILRESGVEIQIDQTTASPGTPFQGSLATSMMGKAVIRKIIETINQGLQAGDLIGVKSELLGKTHVTLDPFPLLRKYLPAGMAGHLRLVQWQTTDDTFLVDVNWQHAE
jgi:hypothetical protein